MHSSVNSHKINNDYKIKGLRSDPVVSVLDRQLRGSGFKSRTRQKFSLRFLLHLRPLAKSAMMSTLTAHCQWEDETARKSTGHPPSYAEAKKMKSLTLQIPGCTIGILRS